MLDLLINAAKIVGPFTLPTIANTSVYYICKYFECDEWYSILGLNLACNSCIDVKKFLKDHQMNMYWSIGTLLVSKIDTIVPIKIE